MKLMQFLMGLDDTYMEIRSSILSRETLPDVRSAYAIISNEESHRVVACLEPLKGFKLLHLMLMLLIEGIFRGLKPLQVSLDLLMRTYLMIMGIGELLGVLPCSSNGFSDEQMTTLISLIKENSVNGKGIHSNMSCTYMNSSSVFNKNFEKFFCSNSLLHSKLVSKRLITDSGANQYMTYTDKNLVNVIDVSYFKIKVTHPNKTEAFITKIGNILLTDYLTLYDALVVPEYCVSLMSVHKVARDSKLIIAFDEIHCYSLN
ncbi:hypothetical protein Tco_1439095 [Tanacetum coccineum]